MKGGMGWIAELRRMTAKEKIKELTRLAGITRRVSDHIIFHSLDAPEVIPVTD